MVKEIRGLKCPNHDYVRDNHHFIYQEVYPVQDRFQARVA